MTPEFWQGKRVLVTGHTGFKGGWLTLWLHKLGAAVYGLSLAPPTLPNFYDVTRIQEKLSGETIGNICDAALVNQVVENVSPDIILHLAAQPIVRHSYGQPVDTFATNVMGTVNLLEAVRKVPSVRAIVNVTTDKCYHNREWVWGYREEDRLGGIDPYSSSKACSELVTSTYRQCFLSRAGVGVATARAGNVIGGGDWAADRLIPDVFRAFDSSIALTIRSPNSIRPWQHVLEPLSGYLKLAELLRAAPTKYAEAWNFGPNDSECWPVSRIVEYLAKGYSGARWQNETSEQPHEAGLLKLDNSKARRHLQWSPRWSVSIALETTVAWHMAWRNGEDMDRISQQQIAQYSAD